MPLRPTFIDLKKVFDSVDIEAVMEALDNQGVFNPYIKILRELYSNFTSKISPFHKNIISDVKREVREGDTISPKFFIATLENAMRKLEWDVMEVKLIFGSYTIFDACWMLLERCHYRFVSDIVLITSSINQAERMLAEFDETCKKNQSSAGPIDVKRRAREGDTTSPKIFTVILEKAMRKLDWDEGGEA